MYVCLSGIQGGLAHWVCMCPTIILFIFGMQTWEFHKTEVPSDQEKKSQLAQKP